MKLCLFLTLSTILLSTHSSIVSPMPENCYILTFLNVCLKCKEGYQLDTNKNICDMFNQTVMIQSNETSKENSSPTIIEKVEAKDEKVLSSGVSIQSIEDLNCKTKGLNGVCIKCYPAFYVNLVRKICEPVSPLCKTWNDMGQCLSCFVGYNLDSGICAVLIEQSPKTQIRDPNCFKYEQNNNCLQCAFRFYFNKQKICTTVHPDCKTWDKDTGACLSCYGGYSLIGAKCLAENNNLLAASTQSIITETKNIFVQIPGCSEYNDKGECYKCAFRFIFDNGQCKPVSNLCKSWSLTDGQCMSCYVGYELFQGKCERKDPFCTIKTKQGCVQCVNRYYLDDNSKCQGVSPLCKAYDPLYGSCTQCYQGYALQKGVCLVE